LIIGAGRGYNWYSPASYYDLIVIAYNASTGDLVWKLNLSEAKHEVFNSMIVHNDRLYCGGSGQGWTHTSSTEYDAIIPVINITTGELILSINLSHPTLVSPNDDSFNSVAYSDDIIFGGGYGERWYPGSTNRDWLIAAFNATTGKLLWNITPYKNPASLATAEQVVSLAVSDNYLIAGGYGYNWAGSSTNMDFSIIAVNKTDGNVVWARNLTNPLYITGGERVEKVIYHDGVVYACGYGERWHSGSTNYDAIVVAINVTTGNVIWSNNISNPVLASGDDRFEDITYSGDVLYAGGQGDNWAYNSSADDLIIAAFNATTGNLIWIKKYFKPK